MVWLRRTDGTTEKVFDCEEDMVDDLWNRCLSEREPNGPIWTDFRGYLAGYWTPIEIIENCEEANWGLYDFFQSWVHWCAVYEPVMLGQFGYEQDEEERE